MNKNYIWIVSIILGTALISLIILQALFFKSVYEQKKEQLELNVNISLNRVSEFLDKLEREKRIYSYIEYKNQLKVLSFSKFKLNNKTYIKSRQLYTKNLDPLKLDYFFSKRDIGEIIDLKKLGDIIRECLVENKIFLDFEYAVKTGGAFQYMSSQFLKNANNKIKYVKTLFNSESISLKYTAVKNKQSVLLIYFPNDDSFYLYVLNFIVPASILILLLIVCSAFTIYIIFRQKRVSKIKNDFINNMTHEFKTPISTISLASQMLKDSTLNTTTSSLDRISGIISAESKRLSFQVEKVLQMSVFDEIEMTLKNKSLNLNNLIDRHIPNFRINVEKRGGSIITNLNPNLKEIEGDEVHIGNLIFNLLDNALKYSKVTPEIIVTTKNKNNKVVLSIADNGIGIAKEEQKMIFERFYRVHTGNLHNIKGFGLGLSYVKKVVDAHNGTIEIESVLDKGSKFTILFPFI